MQRRLGTIEVISIFRPTNINTKMTYEYYNAIKVSLLIFTILGVIMLSLSGSRYDILLIASGIFLFISITMIIFGIYKNNIELIVYGIIIMGSLFLTDVFILINYFILLLSLIILSFLIMVFLQIYLVKIDPNNNQ